MVEIESKIKPYSVANDIWWKSETFIYSFPHYPFLGIKLSVPNIDIDSMSRAAFLCAFSEEAKRGDAHGFFVRYTKFQTVDERRGITGSKP